MKWMCLIISLAQSRSFSFSSSFFLFPSSLRSSLPIDAHTHTRANAHPYTRTRTLTSTAPFALALPPCSPQRLLFRLLIVLYQSVCVSRPCLHTSPLKYPPLLHRLISSRPSILSRPQAATVAAKDTLSSISHSSANLQKHIGHSSTMGAIQSFLAADLLPHAPHPHPYEPVEAYCKMLESLIQKRYKEALDYCTPATSQPCQRIYRNWHPDDQQRKEKQLEHIQSRFLLSYPAEKYNLVREDDHSPVVNPFFNLSGLFFCATGSPPQSDADDTGAGAGGPVITSPYGKTRFQVEFGQLQRVLFPSFKLYFADHYKVVADWYIQLIVVPSWNVQLEEQCVQQGMVELDIESNPFFYRADDGQYWVSNCPKLWMELFIGCDTIPTTDLGEVVESRLHEKVRKTRNHLTEQEERERHARVIENVANDLVKLAEGLRQGLGPMDRELVDLTYGLSMSRTQLGVKLSGQTPTTSMELEEKEESREE